ncbi:hypothetical protein [Desulforamulus reducens]|uniref:hypothetical protein n=1 Tax=Desulforamulus reducens TaxID=59610 RepID=UPI0012E9EA92|nr:hypothetical protein [Desulforamulus reducens]
MIIKDIRIKTGLNGYIEVETEDGGYGKSVPRRGITPNEARLAKTLIGRKAFCSQTLVLEAFGRFYGQGISETPVSLQTAISNAALDTFVKCYPSEFKFGYEDLDGSCGLIAGAVLDFDGIPVSVLGTVNASINGIGPNEDMEGNSAIGKKGEIMAELGMVTLPTVVIEAKVHNELFSKVLNEGTFLVKADKQQDNPFVAHSIFNAANDLNFPVIIREDVMARVPGGMEKQTRELANKIVCLGENLKNAQFSQEKLNILAELALLISQDGGGISFMSNKLHEIIGGAGTLQGTSAVINYCVPSEYYKEYLIPFITEDDLQKYVMLTKQAVKELFKVLPDAVEHAQKHCCSSSLEDLVLKS